MIPSMVLRDKKPPNGCQKYRVPRCDFRTSICTRVLHCITYKSKRLHYTIAKKKNITFTPNKLQRAILKQKNRITKHIWIELQEFYPGNVDSKMVNFQFFLARSHFTDVSIKLVRLVRKLCCLYIRLAVC